jgi:hypothetical protein
MAEMFSGYFKAKNSYVPSMNTGLVELVEVGNDLCTSSRLLAKKSVAP